MKLFSNLKIGPKMIAGFVIVILLAGVVGVVGITGLNSMNNAIQDVTTANDMTKQALEARSHEKSYMITGDTSQISEVEGAITELSTNMQLMANAAAAQKYDTSILDKMFVAVGDYTSAFEDYVKAVEDNDVVLNEWTKIGAGFNEEIAQIRNVATRGDDVYLQADKLETTFVLMRVAAVYYIRTSTDAKWAEFQKAMTETEEEVDVLKSISSGDATVTASVNTISDYIDDYILQADIYHNNEQIKADAETRTTNAGDRIIGSDEIANTMYGGATLIRTNAQLNAANVKSSSTNMVIIFLVAAVLAGIGIALVLSRGISNGIKTIVNALAKISVGDLTEEVNVKTNDEIGIMAKTYGEMQAYLQEMAGTAGKIADGNLAVEVKAKSKDDTLSNAFSRMLENLRQLIGSVRSIAENIAESSAQLSNAADQAGQATQQIAATSQQVARGASEQSTALQETSTGMDQLSKAIMQISLGAQEQAKGVERNVEIVNKVSAAVLQVTSNAQVAADGSQKAGEAARKGTDMTRQTVQGMQKIKDAMDIASAGVTSLGERSNEIGKIVATIDDIAAQTNLLALNAAIEAARAGEQGRGFAVVADEVRKLAERSSTATKEIADLISNIQTGVNEAVRAMEDGNHEVNSGYDLATNAGSSLDEILETVMEVSREVDRIAEASTELNSLSEEMVKITDGVSSVVEENTATTEEMSASSDEVTKAIESVAGVAEENSAATEQVSASAEEMSAQVEEVVASAQSLAQMAEDLRNNIAIFKLTNAG